MAVRGNNGMFPLNLEICENCQILFTFINYTWGNREMNKLNWVLRNASHSVTTE